MRKRRIYLALLILTAAGLVSLIVAGAFREREPEYGGKKLSKWVGGLTLHGTRSGELPIEGAICHIGTNAIPYLVNWIGYETPQWKLRLYDVFNDSRVPGIGPGWTDKKDVRANQAIRAFEILGPQARAAIPALIRLMNGPDPNAWSAIRAVDALSALGDDGLPNLLAAVTNQQSDLRLRHYVVFRIGPKRLKSRIAMPALQQLLKDPDATMRDAATNALLVFDLEALERAWK